MTELSKLERMVEEFWTEVARGWDIEPRAYFEANYHGLFYSPIGLAVHHMWKRCLKDQPDKLGVPAVSAGSVCPHCELPPVLPDVCTPEIHAAIERNIARDWELFDAGREHEATHQLLAVSAGGADPPMTFDQFSAVNRERCESPSGFKHALDSWSTSDWFLAVLGELGEAANVAKKLNRVRDGITGNKEPIGTLNDKLRQELGDAFVYLDLLAQSLGVSIGAAAVEVFNAKSKEIGCSILMPASPLSRPAPRAPELWGLDGLIARIERHLEDVMSPSATHRLLGEASTALQQARPAPRAGKEPI